MSDSSVRVVRVAVAPLLREPRISSEQISQRLAGHALEVLESRAPWLHVRGEDGYTGWIHDGYVRLPHLHEGAADAAAPRISIGCTVRRADGSLLRLPPGALLDEDWSVVEGEALTRELLARRFPPTADALVRTARSLFEGTPYEWGGITPWGADCSGFLQSCFGLHGTSLPRDAWQQAELGSPVDGDQALRAADLLFFTERDDGRITHVALAVDAARIVHVALGRGGFAIERWDADDGYVVALRSRHRLTRRPSLG